jgi:hypothetical protein
MVGLFSMVGCRVIFVVLLYVVQMGWNYFAPISKVVCLCCGRILKDETCATTLRYEITMLVDAGFL